MVRYQPTRLHGHPVIEPRPTNRHGRTAVFRESLPLWTQASALVITHISGFLIVLVLNEMVLVLVIEAPNRSITSTSTVLWTEHEHEVHEFYSLGVERCG